ncbi:uncharacterized protein LOC9327397 [Arabidopsis lyrata subsp. lyrata]|uniref:uncharacterized protein LOC9327397 n=1 Tax=Arabidopsis lyrata subsp. lyrata TaxID=81972 RepID=UPI000A29AA00|nr:uncharacterized protein LOC9327397 [Arabidopsis lyrata subsp. lyrata]|eukprot:XP_020869723.1 uncharacterized protein LOC9327397 [Arabidopsis lyrata subsp. lyrata]
MINQTKVSFVLIILTIAAKVTESEFSDSHDAKITRLLKKLNKPALKSIKSPDGDIIDCVHMKNHPIYDHPLFKNHTIQMRPSSYPEGMNNEPSDQKKENLVTQLWTTNGKCPKNSIPIRRTTREDILRAKSIESFGKKTSNRFTQPSPVNSTSNDGIHEYAILEVHGKFHGASSIINVWKPYVRTEDEFSLAQIWLVAGPPGDELNAIEFGWQVYEGKYHDNNPRYFIFWTADGYRTGCYNFDCHGFVLVSREIALGGAIANVSTLGGQQYQIPVSIWKDEQTGDWWLKLYYTIFVGYWPSSLFTHLRDSASIIEWGGEILDFKDDGRHTTTRMGGGYFAQEGLTKAAYFKNLEIVDEHNIWRRNEGGHTIMTQESCYNIQSAYHDTWGNFFYYGGPGRNQNCM